MVSDKTILRAFRTHTTLSTKPIRNFFNFHYLPKLYIGLNLNLDCVYPLTCAARSKHRMFTVSLPQGYLVNWDVQRQVWDYMFGKEFMALECSDTTAVVTEPYFNFSSVQEAMNEIFFEEYQFKALLRINGR